MCTFKQNLVPIIYSTRNKMGNITTSISNALFSLFGGFKKETKILMLGLDGAGKTTIMYKYKPNQVSHTIPTIGFNVETIQIYNVNMTMWDIGGQNKIRELWKHYYQGTDCLIWVVDASDKERLSEMKEELYSVLNEPELQKCTILIFANRLTLKIPNSLMKTNL